jgi:hypothetical protein
MSFLRRFAPPQIIVAASVPFVGYALAFMYERGYTGRFGVPTWMMRVTLMQALIASVVAAVLVAATPTIARTVSRVTSQWLVSLVLAPLAALAVAIWAASETQWVMGKHLLIPMTLIAAFGGFAALRIYRSLVVPVMGKHGGTAMERLKASAVRGNGSQPIAALAWMGYRVRWTLAVLVVALFGAHWAGNYRSRNQQNFLVSSSAPTCVAVQKNADGIVCAITDLTRRRVLPQLRVMPPAAAAKEKLTLATLPTLRSPLDADRKLFAAPRPAGTTGTVYANREATVTQAGKPRATTPAKKPTTKTAAAKRTTTAKKPAAKTTAKKKTTTRR